MWKHALILVLLAPLLAHAQDAETKQRFAKLSKSFNEVRRSALWEEIKTRRDLINQLGDLDHPGVVPILYQAFTKDREQVCRIPAMIGLGKRGNTKVLKSLVMAVVKDRNDVYAMCLPLAFAHVTDPEIGPWLMKNLLGKKRNLQLRAAVIESLGLIRCSEAYEPIRKVLVGETSDLRTRYETLIALARIGGPQASDIIIPYLSDDDRVLREGAVVALGETGHPGAVEEVLPLVKDVCPRVQESVAEVAAKAKSEEAIPALIGLLKTGRLRVIDSARRALQEITDEKLGIDPGAWERWLKERAKGEAGQPEVKDEVGSVATYYGMRIFSDRILFIIDVSGSMKAGEPTRLETAKEEMKKTLDQLNRKTMFNIVVFSGNPVWWREEEVEADPENLANAKEFVEDLNAGGGTNVYDTFAEAFELNRQVDTIYFLGDGSPSLGTHTEQEEILARIRWMNRFRKVHIHCIALIRGEVGRFGGRMGPGLGRGRSRSGERAFDEEEAARFLARLAAEHNGTFLKIDK